MQQVGVLERQLQASQFSTMTNQTIGFSKQVRIQ